MVEASVVVIERTLQFYRLGQELLDDDDFVTHGHVDETVVDGDTVPTLPTYVTALRATVPTAPAHDRLLPNPASVPKERRRCELVYPHGHARLTLAHKNVLDLLRA